MPWIKLEGGGVAHVRLCRQKRRRCRTCAVLGAELECDGCDKALCRSCAVSPKPELDFCPACFDPAWKAWLQLRPSSLGSETRAQRRAAFRAWVLLNVERFLELARPLTAASVQARAQRSES